MNVKRILIIGLILVAVAASLSVVSADSSVKIRGVDFNIPDGFAENASLANERGDLPIPANMSLRGFDKGDDPLTCDRIMIYVYECSSPQDANKVQDAISDSVRGRPGTMNGHDGITYHTDAKFSGFGFCKDKYFIMIETNDESLLESVVPK